MQALKVHEFGSSIRALSHYQPASRPTCAVLGELLDALHIPAQVFDGSGRPQCDTLAFRILMDADADAPRLRSAVMEAAAACAQRGLSSSVQRLQDPVGARRTRAATSRFRARACRVPDGPAAEAIVVAVERTAPVALTDEQLRNQFRLTPREIEVAVLLAAGFSNDEISTSLELSPHTVRRHAEQILLKLGVHRRGLVGPRLRGGDMWAVSLSYQSTAAVRGARQ